MSFPLSYPTFTTSKSTTFSTKLRAKGTVLLRVIRPTTTYIFRLLAIHVFHIVHVLGWVHLFLLTLLRSNLRLHPIYNSRFLLFFKDLSSRQRLVTIETSRDLTALRPNRKPSLYFHRLRCLLRVLNLVQLRVRSGLVLKIISSNPTVLSILRPGRVQRVLNHKSYHATRTASNLRGNRTGLHYRPVKANTSRLPSLICRGNLFLYPIYLSHVPRVIRYSRRPRKGRLSLRFKRIRRGMFITRVRVNLLIGTLNETNRGPTSSGNGTLNRQVFLRFLVRIASSKRFLRLQQETTSVLVREVIIVNSTRFYMNASRHLVRRLLLLVNRVKGRRERGNRRLLGLSYRRKVRLTMVRLISRFRLQKGNIPSLRSISAIKEAKDGLSRLTTSFLANPPGLVPLGEHRGGTLSTSRPRTRDRGLRNGNLTHAANSRRIRINVLILLNIRRVRSTGKVIVPVRSRRRTNVIQRLGANGRVNTNDATNRCVTPKFFLG